jgi:catechol 2,3-dioxygenase-like lactoylglutathione lyase family enzyme
MNAPAVQTKGAPMLMHETKAVAMVAVKDLQAAQKFYEDVLGLPQESKQGDEVVTYRCGGSLVSVYRSEFAGTNKATTINFEAGKDVASLAKALKAKGVTFERYDMPGMTLQGDVYVGEGMNVAWFKDPDGNILSIAGR